MQNIDIKGGNWKKENGAGGEGGGGKASEDQAQVKSFLFQTTFSSQASVILDQGVKLPQDIFSILQKMLQVQVQ